MFDGALSVEFCPTCRADQLVEVPPCSDGHADCCADRACTVCGTALVHPALATAALWTASHATPARRAAAAPRHAA